MGIYQKILAGKITFPKIFHKEAGIFPPGGWVENRGVTFYLWIIIFDPYWESCIVLLLKIILYIIIRIALSKYIAMERQYILYITLSKHLKRIETEDFNPKFRLAWTKTGPHFPA